MILRKLTSWNSLVLFECPLEIISFRLSFSQERQRSQLNNLNWPLIASKGYCRRVPVE